MSNAIHVMIAVIASLLFSMRDGVEPVTALVAACLVAMLAYFWCRLVDRIWP